MTLAVLLFVSILSTGPTLPRVLTAILSQQTPPADKPANGAGTQNQEAGQSNSSTTAKPTPSAQTPVQTSSEPKPVTKPRRHKKKISEVDCTSTPATAQEGPPSGNASPNAAAGSAQNSGTPVPPTADAPKKKCAPPPKIVVRQGGTAEPSIQLAGGAGGGQAAEQRDTANRMLEATETNLKKLSGQQLTHNQQDMVNQVHQFMEESRTAVAAGDLDRGRTLAWKAQLLSEELVKPPEK